MKSVILATVLVTGLLCGAAQASPSPSVQMRDQIIAASPGRYTVLRFETFFPGSYYAYRRRLSVLTISAWTNQIQEGCVLSEARWATDAAKDDGVWFIEQQLDPTCGPGAMAVGAGQNPVQPFPFDPGRALGVGDSLPARYVATRFDAVTADWYDHVSDYSVVHAPDQCRFHEGPLRADGVDWVFVPYDCGEDADQILVYIPVSGKTWRQGQ